MALIREAIGVRVNVKWLSVGRVGVTAQRSICVCVLHHRQHAIACCIGRCIVVNQLHSAHAIDTHRPHISTHGPSI